MFHVEHQRTSWTTSLDAMALASSGGTGPERDESLCVKIPIGNPIRNWMLGHLQGSDSLVS